MEKKINNILLLTANDGTQMTFKVLFTYHSEKFNRDYVVFYNEKDENHLLAYAYDENITLLAYAYDENITLQAIETQEEAAELQQALDEFDAEQAAQQ